MKKTWKKYVIRAKFYSPKLGVHYRTFETWEVYHNYLERYPNLRAVSAQKVWRM